MNYTWLPLYKELAHWVLHYREKQNELCDILRQIGFSGNLEDEDSSGKKVPLMAMDPFTFFAFFMKIKNLNNRTEYFKKLKEVIGLKSEIPKDYNGVPSAQPMMLWYFKFKSNRPPEVMKNLWDLAEQTVEGKLEAGTFQEVYDRPGIQIAKLSQALFWLNPEEFYPIDAHKNYLKKKGINIDVENLSDYLKILEQVIATFKKPFYEVSYEAWRNNNEKSIVDDEPVKTRGITPINYVQKTSTNALNTILYGPPGTGKTYNSINKAVQIVDEEFYNKNKESRNQITRRFNDLLIKDLEKSEGQIAFCTFHQSMSYEDFIEGIKPVLDGEKKEDIQYQIKDGIFKTVARMASDATEEKEIEEVLNFQLSEYEFNKVIFYKMSLGNSQDEEDDDIYEYCIQNNCVALGWGGPNDLTGLDQNNIFKTVLENEGSDFSAQQANMFIHYIKQGDYVIISNGNYRFRAIGKVTSPYYYKPDTPIRYHHFKNVQWVLKDIDLPTSDIYSRNFQQQTLYKLKQQELKKDFFIPAASTTNKKEQNRKQPLKYVLIVDEINRGNIAQIFGELITLLEDNKRIGKNNIETLTVTLPYSKKPFGVPDNLYIIGTMNTADRSVEALDTALRRRFVFEEMQPKSGLLSPKELLKNFYNKEEYAEHDWDDDPFKTNAQYLYELLGVDKSIEQRTSEGYDKDGGLWKVDHFDVIADAEFNGVNLHLMLNTINERLESILSKDHTIGHAWLMEVYSLYDLQSAFKNKILPLLQEYFYNNYAKIGWVLGNAFIKRKSSKGIFAKDFIDADDAKSDFEEKVAYSLVNPFELGLEAFKAIY